MFLIDQPSMTQTRCFLCFKRTAHEVMQLCTSESVPHHRELIVRWLFIAVFICFGLGSLIQLSFFQGIVTVRKLQRVLNEHQTGCHGLWSSVPLLAFIEQPWPGHNFLGFLISISIKLGWTRWPLKNFQFYYL